MAVHERDLNIEVPGPVACEACDLQEICRILDRASNRLPTGRLRNLRAGEALYRTGAPADFLYATRKGVLKSVGVGRNNQSRLRAIHVPGEAFGAEGFTGSVYASDVIALTPTIVCELPHAAFTSENLMRVPELNLALTRLRERLNVPRNDLRSGSLAKRTKAFFAHLGQRLTQRGFKPDRFTLPVTRKELGTLFDARVDAVSRALRRLNREGEIHMGRKQVSLRSSPHFSQGGLARIASLSVERISASSQ